MLRQFSGPLRQRSAPRGVSILEVLFAILITAIGLMGAISVFPAAMLQAKRGMQADECAVAGLRAIHTFDAEGMRKPTRWLLPSSSAPPSPWPGTVTAPQVPPPDGQFAFCIDPRFVAANAGDNSATYFPYGATGSPIVRVTLNNGVPSSTVPMSTLHADLAFRVEDDLAYDRFRKAMVVRDDSTPAASLFIGGYGTPLKRETQGHVSWMATLAPKLERLPTGVQLEDRYVLSIVVFHDRPAQLQASSGFQASEWVVPVNPIGGWVNGGEVTLSAPTSLPTGITAEESVDVRTGQWIMLVGQTTLGSPSRRMPLCRWYRVLDADSPNNTAAPVTNAVTLAGADFTDFNNGSPVGIICRGVVAVFEKTITLEPGL